MAKLTIWKTDFTDLQSLMRDVARFFKQNPSLITTTEAATDTNVSTVLADGATTSGTNFTSVLSDFVTDAVVPGDYVTILKSDELANVGRHRVVSVTNLTTLVLDANLVTDTVMTFTVDQNKMFQLDNDVNIDILD